MLMPTPKDELQQLRPISSALSREDFAYIERRALAISASLECRQPERFAEVYEGVTPHWHAVLAMPGQERTAADDLSDRRFGVYIPESEHTEVRRGRAVDIKRLMLPGYVLVFVWSVDEHIDRIKACDGVRGLLMINGTVAIIGDRLVDRIREAENRERPLKGLVAPPKRKRKSRNPPQLKEGEFTADEIVGSHSYSPFIEAMRAEADADRLSAFHKAIGLAA